MNSTNKTATKTRKTAARTSAGIRKMTMTAMLSAVGFILMFLEFSVPVMPFFIKMDLSELPALIGTFALGPVSGVMICLIKNLLHLFVSSTGGVGELSNFILGACFVLPAGLVYKKWRSKRTAALGALTGALLMSLISIGTNYFVVYPVYYAFLPEATVLEAYQKLPQAISFLPQVDNILECLIKYNAPFTFVNGLFSVGIAMLIYKPLSPILKGAGE